MAAVDDVSIFIGGFMATGKTAVGRELARALGLQFVDADERIAEAAEMSVPEIFRRFGESRFRHLEEVHARELASLRGTVVATGGGMLTNPVTMKLLHDAGQLVLLEASVDTLAERLEGDPDRPMLWKDGVPVSGDALRERIADLLDDRRAAYSRIKTKIDTTDRSPRESARAVIAAMKIETTNLTIKPAPLHDDALGRHGGCRIDIGRGALATLPARLQDIAIARHVVVVMPRAIESYFRGDLEATFNDASVACDVVLMNDGDGHKRLDQVSSIVDAIAATGAQRDSTVVAVGGGTTGDVAGFAAAIYMRGVPLVQVPTTLLAQVDASIGGKTGVNLGAAKNQIGTFYQPHLVVSDPAALQSLPDNEISNGMAEVVKSALIGSPQLFHRLCSATEGDNRLLRDVSFLQHCVTESARVKVDIVNRDPFERNERRKLNLGHTVAHGLEAIGNYEDVSHGQAVSLGLVAALRIAHTRGHVDDEMLASTVSLLDWCGLPTNFSPVDETALIEAISRDKKHRAGKLYFVLPGRPGHISVVDDVSSDDILRAVRSR